jgi:biotin-(acetyl-CoA carboxylase) ligase
VLSRYASEGFTSFRAEWEQRHSLHGKRARVLPADGSVVEGVVAGVDAQGALLLVAGSSRLRCLSGDVSLRAAA